MSSSKEESKVKDAIQVLLTESEEIYKRVHSSAFLFLILGLLVAAGGVLYFYISNDALFLDRALYEDRINQAESDFNKAVADNSLLVKVYGQRATADNQGVKVLNNTLALNNKILNEYTSYANKMVKIYEMRDGEKKDNIFFDFINRNADVINDYKKRVNKTSPYSIDELNASYRVIEPLLEKYQSSANSPTKVSRVSSSYDKPELVFSPKLVYGFFSRLGGLIFIELIAFYLLKQYRINMNDFKHYYEIARHIRVNSYLINSIEKLDDEKNKIDIVSRIFSQNYVSINNSNQSDTDSPFSTSDMEAARKLLETVKDFIKK